MTNGGAVFILVILLFALPVFAGTSHECTVGPDFDGDGWSDECDNCDAVSSNDQNDTDADGFGNVCDSDFDQNGVVDGGDFAIFVGVFGSLVPPTSAVYDIAPNGVVDGADFAVFVNMFGGFPGPACGNGVGGPGCPR